MATLQTRNGSHRLLFQYANRQHSFTIGRVSQKEAGQWKARAEQLLMRLKQRLLDLPPGVDIVTFIEHDGRPPAPAEIARQAQAHTCFHDLREAYLRTHGNGAMESNTLYTARIHLTHIEATLGRSFVLSGLTLAHLQRHIDRRQSAVSPVTIKKELDSFRAAWNWGARMQLVDGPFPCRGLVYPKTDEKLPFMNWEEIDRRLKAGGDPDTLWECLYLTPDQIAQLLRHAADAAPDDWFHPMLVMAAYTGARRSELIRTRCEDIDLVAMAVTIREKKRARGTRTTRRVPVCAPLAAVLQNQMRQQTGKPYLFGPGHEPLTVADTQKGWFRAFRRSSWSVVRGYHVLRHSFISALASKGIDQRIIDDCVGHSTEAQRKRYRHLYPAVARDALSRAFA